MFTVQGFFLYLMPSVSHFVSLSEYVYSLVLLSLPCLPFALALSAGAASTHGVGDSLLTKPSIQYIYTLCLSILQTAHNLRFSNTVASSISCTA